MSLEMGTFHVEKVILGDKTFLEQRTLFINPRELEELLLKDPALAKVKIEIVGPGENARIIHIMDAVEPRIKIKGGDMVYPGIESPVYRGGSGTTYRLDGVAVITSCLIPLRKAGGLYIAREGILDMAGPNAPLTPFSQTWNVVPVIAVQSGLDEETYEKALRNAGVIAARYLGEVMRELTPDSLQLYSTDEKNPDLPNVIYINQLESCGLYGRNYLYGMSFDDLLPTMIHPNELMDGAIVNALHSHTAVQTPTYYQTNNPIVEELYKRHGKSWNFNGVIVCRGHFEDIDSKYRCANLVAGMAQMMQAQGVIATWECGGNTFMETMLYLKECEQMGMKTVLVTYEHGGADGRDNPLFYFEPEVNSIVSTGSLDRAIHYPPVDRVVGGDMIRLYPEEGGVLYPAHQALDLNYRLESWCSCNNVGIVNTSCDEF
ncbi:glycine/sarcosine/betaine reductase component B subunit [Dehalobacterium formicoaceticum]|uniref:glycine/sarcosine/betaine reductase component B subunit n=1 Tax=Dehalobacterium formicoaceticum TaxID=51515 RepID=UPI0031F5F8D0